MALRFFFAILAIQGVSGLVGGGGADLSQLPPEAGQCVATMYTGVCGDLMAMLSGALDYTSFCSEGCVATMSSDSCQALKTMPGLGEELMTVLDPAGLKYLCSCLVPVDPECGLLSLGDDDAEESQIEDEMPTEACCAAMSASAECANLSTNITVVYEAEKYCTTAYSSVTAWLPALVTAVVEEEGVVETDKDSHADHEDHEDHEEESTEAPTDAPAPTEAGSTVVSAAAAPTAVKVDEDSGASSTSVALVVAAVMAMVVY